MKPLKPLEYLKDDAPITMKEVYKAQYYGVCEMGNKIREKC